jgi:hypothetical protein
MASREIDLDEQVQLLFAEAYARGRAEALGRQDKLPMNAADIEAVRLPDPRPYLCPIYKANKDRIRAWLAQKVGAVAAAVICAALDNLCP